LEVEHSGAKNEIDNIIRNWVSIDAFRSVLSQLTVRWSSWTSSH